MGLSRREFVQGAVAGAALTAAPAAAFAAFADDADKQAVLQEIPKMHAENVHRLQEYGSRCLRSPLRSETFRRDQNTWRSWRGTRALPM